MNWWPFKISFPWRTSKNSVSYASAKRVEELEKRLKRFEDRAWEDNRKNLYAIESLENTFGWRKVTKHLDGWKKPAEFVEFYAHIYVLDQGYRKRLWT